MTSYTYIDTTAELEQAVASFESEKNIGVDLEADSMFHFKEKVCLIQIVAGEKTVVIDPLKIPDLSPLNPLFASPSIRKIFHGSDYDVRSLYRDFQIEINNLFDTELASRFMGITETGLSSVLFNRFNVKLDKSYQKKDWSLRPLSQDMIEYGAGDVKYLLPLAKMLDRELEDKSRTHWVAEECTLLSRVRPVESNGQPHFMKVKGAGRLDGRSLACLEALLVLRQRIAEKKDKPLFKITSTSSLVNIAKSKPATPKQLKETKALSPRQIDMFGKEILNEISRARKLDAKDLPAYPRSTKPYMHPAVPGRIQLIKDFRDKRAAEMELDPPILMNKALITAIAVANPKSTDELKSVETMKNWQRQEFGSQIIEVLNH